MQTVETSLLEISLETGGPEDGPPVLLLHGWPDDATAWRSIAPALEEAGYRWVAPWLRGFGPTRFLADETPRDGTGVAIAQDALDLADAIGWDRFAVVGHDWGGRAAYILAAIAPERVISITSLAIGYAPHGRFVYRDPARTDVLFWITSDISPHARTPMQLNRSVKRIPLALQPRQCQLRKRLDRR
jgi:pimeloyl-ACP methyl ester carboxylesterase